MALRIACDLDGTLADMEGALQREAERLFGPDVDVRARGHVVLRASSDEGKGEVSLATDESAPAASPVKKPLTDRQMRQLWAHVRTIENFWTTLKEIEPGAVATLASLASLHGWEIIFLTQRPDTAGDTAQTQSQWWLYEHGFRFPSVFVMNGSRGKVATALQLDAVIDDRRENCLDVTTDSEARSILIWRDDPKTAPAAASRLGISVVYSFAEALEHLHALMADAASSPGVVKRLRTALGI